MCCAVLVHGQWENWLTAEKASHMRNETAQFLRYAVAAGFGLLVDYGLLVISIELLRLPLLWATTIGFVAGLIVNFLLSERYVFAEARLNSRWARFSVFAGIGVVGVVILNVLMFLLVRLASLNYVLAKTLATVLVYIWNYVARRAMYGQSTSGLLPRPSTKEEATE